jgi:signal peptide peptidase SppA
MDRRLQALDGTLWLCEPGRLKLAVEKAIHLRPCPTAREVVTARCERLEEARQAAGRAVRGVKGKIGIIPVHGPIDQRMTGELLKLGGTSTEEVGVALDALVADPAVGAVVLHIDSPGGNVYGVEELSDKIFAARGQKDLYAVADSMAASAALWIATSATQFFVTPGGDVGSVGVYSLHADMSKALENEGVTVTLINAGKYKVEGNPFEPLGGEARDHFQERVDDTYGKFLRALERNRGVTAKDVRNDFGQGRLLNAQQAVAAKMADRVMTYEALVQRLAGGAGTEKGRAASAGMLRALRVRQEHRHRAS